MTSKLREEICKIGQSLYARGYTAGSSGNISVRLPDGGWLMTPTNIAMGDLDPAELALIDAQGRFVSGPKPTKESFLHLAMYRHRADAGAVVHLHSTHAVAVSMLEETDPDAAIPPLTAYAGMELGKVKLVAYFPPGDPALGDAVAAVAGKHHAVLLANHGPVVAGKDLRAAQYASEELEETAKLLFILGDRRYRALTPDAILDLQHRFPS
jgi:ribulose-5-phosphate 4-epimerase/fuculose-1-phosphate aldolase